MGQRQLIRFGHGWWALPGILAMAVAVYAATLAGGFYAFTDWTGLGGYHLVGLDNFTRILQDRTMRTVLVHTLELAAGFVLATNVLWLLLALALNRGVKSRYVLRTLLFMPAVLSPLAVSYLWRFIFQYDGPLNALLDAIGLDRLQRTWLADPSLSLWVVLFVMVWQATGLTMVVYLAGLATVPVELEEAAAMEGAGAVARLWHVVLPMVRPSVVVAVTLTTVQGLRTFDQVLALTGGGPAGATDTLATEVYRQAFNFGSFGFGAALALTLTVVVLVFVVLLQTIARERTD